MNCENCENSSENVDLESVIYRSFENSNQPQELLKNIKKGINLLTLYPITDVEDLLKYIMLAIPQILTQIYDENNVVAQSGKNEIVSNLKSNFQLTLSIMDISNQILDYITIHKTVPFSYVPNLPINMAQVLLLTFEHCRNSQKIYHSIFKSVSEILDLFKKSQEVHTKFFNFLDASLTFNFFNENEVNVFKQLLDTIVKISEVLSGINIKSMADNWKGFITLVQKYSNVPGAKSFDVSSAVNSLINEIDKNIQSIYELESVDLKKSAQILKITGFLIKVVLKLFEVEPNILENCDDVLNFCLIIYSRPCGIFQTERFPAEVVEAINNILYLHMEAFVNQLFTEAVFMKKLCSLDKNNKLLVKYCFGFLYFSNKLLNKLPKILQEKSEILRDVDIISLLCLIFNCTKYCYELYFYDYNSIFYEELLVNVSVTILLLPKNYLQIEKILLDCLIQEKIWTAMMATDIWCMVLRHSSVSTSRSTLNMLITKIQELNVGIFVETPDVIHLKILVQRIFKILPNNVKNEKVSKYNPTHNLLLWKILNLRDIPLSQRFYIEFVLSDLFDKMDNMEKEDCSVNETVLLMQNLDIISSTKFNSLEINTSRLVSCISRLWSFNVYELSLSNIFFKYFIYKLTKLSKAVIKDLTGECLLLILSQLKQLLSETIFHLLVCDILQAISQKNVDNFQEKFAFLSLISEIFQILLTNKNPVLIQISLETFQGISENDSYKTVVNKTLTSSSFVKKLIIDFRDLDSTEIKYNKKYFEKLQNSTFQHRCLEWRDSAFPQYKKIKIDSKMDDLIDNLKINSQKLSMVVTRTQLNPRQVDDIKNVVIQLEMLLNLNAD